MIVAETELSNLIRAIEQADSPVRLVEAVRALAEAQLPDGIPTLIAALGYNNPEAASIAVDGLVRLGEVAVPLLLERIDEYNYGARAFSFRALAAIGDPRALNTLISAARADFAPSVRRAAAKGLGQLQWLKLPDDEQRAAQETALQTLLELTEDPEWGIRYVAVVSLQALATSSVDLRPVILERLNQLSETDSEIALRCRIWLAQQVLAE